MAFLTDDDLKAALAAALHMDAAAMPAYWDGLIPAANTRAQDEILAALTARGYSAGTAEAWDRAAEFNRDLGRYFAAVDDLATFKPDITSALLDKWDRREELQTVAVLIDGEPVDPDAADATPAVTGGAMRRRGDCFRPPCGRRAAADATAASSADPGGVLYYCDAAGRPYYSGELDLYR